MKIDLSNKMKKGLSITPSGSVLEFLSEALYDIYGEFNARQELLGIDGEDFEALAKQFWSDEVLDERPEYILDLLESKGWMRVKDNFGDKVIKSRPFPNSKPPLDTDELRVTVYINKKLGGVWMDIRPWGQWD